MRFQLRPIYRTLFRSGSFNSLYEILFKRLALLRKLPPFNSLYEIHLLEYFYYTIDIFLSILFMRFVEIMSEEKLDITLAFNSLYDIHMCYPYMQPKPPAGFQFSLWDSCLLGLIPLLLIQAFNSLYEIHFKADCILIETPNFQFSLWDSPKGRFIWGFINVAFNSLYEIQKDTIEMQMEMSICCFQFSLWDSAGEP